MHFPVDRLKVDRSFIANVTTDQHNAALTTTIVAMAKSLGMSTVAEGVETAEQYRFVKSLGCSETQGYWLSKPVPAAQIPAALENISKLVQSEMTIDRKAG